MKVSGNDLFVTAMKKEGVDTIFAYPGGMVVNLLDALHDCHSIDLVLPRHEQGLIHAADGYARATGKVGVCLVTSGPGATNLVTGIATANYDSIPLVCFTGQVPEHLIGNDAFQEVDIIGVTRNIAKFVIMVRDREMLAQRIKEAFYIARSGKPGPVLVDLPTDVMAELGSTSYPTEVNIRGYKPNKGVHVGQLKKAITLLEEAKKPMFLIGGGVNLAHAQQEMTKLAEKIDAPVITTVMGRGAISTEHPLYIGNIGMHGSYAANKTADECDLMFSIGCRFNDRVTGEIKKFAPNAKIVHIDIESAAISRNVTVDIPIVADAKAAILKILEHTEPMEHKEWLDEIQGWDKEYPLQMEVKDGTLIVNYSYDKRTLINFSSEDSSPRLVITRKDPSSIKTVDADLSWGDVLLQNMTIDSAVLKLSDGDVDLTGTQIGTLNAELDYGDIEGDHVSCTTLSVNLKDGDCELDGTFNGDVNISSQYGDIEIFTRLAESQYTVSAGSSYGDVEVGGTTKEDGGTLTLGAGPYKMALQSDDGDVNVRFGSK